MAQRLNSWESIGTYLGKSARTVQRWHARYGLPVHHLSGERSSVFAYSDKLDEWMRSRGRAQNQEPLSRAEQPVRYSTSESLDRNRLHDPHTDRGTDQARSADLVARAQDTWRILSRLNLKAVTRYYREAIDLDANNASAYAGLAHALIAECLWGIVSGPTVYPEVLAAVDMAFKIDPDSLESECAAAWFEMIARRHWKNAEKGFDDVLRQQPLLTRALVGRSALYIAAGNLKAASSLLLKVAQRNALSAPAATLQCWLSYLSGEFLDAIEQADQVEACGQIEPILSALKALASIKFEQRHLSISRIETMVLDLPEFDVLRGALGHAYAVNGYDHRANRILDSLTYEAEHGKHQEPYASALVLMGLNRNEQAVAQLGKGHSGAWVSIPIQCWNRCGTTPTTNR